MYYPAILTLNNYIPLQLEIGMYFKDVAFPNHVEVWTLLIQPTMSLEYFFELHGYPVEIMILDEDGETLAEGSQIGWWDEGEHTDDLRDINLKDINTILKDGGLIEIDISNEAYQINQVIPTIADGKVILRTPVYEEEEEIPDNEIEEEY